MLQEQVVPIDFGQGLDTKTDPKAVVAGKFIRLENGVFTNIKRVSKRNGYTALSTTVASIGTMQAPRLVHSYGDELLAVDQNRLLSYSSSQSAWEAKGHYTSVELKRNNIDQGHVTSGYVDCAVLGNYILYGWSTVQNAADSVHSKVFGSVVDIQNGSIVSAGSSGSLLSTQTGAVLADVKCIVLGTTVLAIAYMKSDQSAVVMRLIQFAGSGVVNFGSELTISTNYAGGNFDIVSSALGANLLYLSTTGITVSAIDLTGTVTATANTVDASAASPISLSANPANGNVWAYWTNATRALGLLTANLIEYAIYNPSSLAVVLAKTTAVTMPAPYTVTNMTQISNGASEQILFYGAYGVMSATDYIDTTVYVSVGSTGTIGTPTVFSYGMAPLSKTITQTLASGTYTYGVFLYRGTVTGAPSNVGTFLAFGQPTYFLLELSFTANASSISIFARAIGRFAYGLANLQCLNQTIISYLPNISAISSTKYLMGCGVRTQEFNSDSFSTFPPGALSGAFSYTIDFASVNANIAVNTGGMAIFNGAMLQAYDGTNISEFGFHLAPEISSLVQSNGSGSIANGVYEYLAIFQWTDSKGNLHQSLPSLASAITTTGVNDTVTITVSSAYLSTKVGVSVALYRTKASGTVFFLITDPVFIQYADPSNISVTFVDGLVDADLDGNPQAYTYPASAVLENDPPPPSMIMLVHNNRLWFVDSENPNTIWYTKSFSPGTGLSPSAFMLEQIDPKFGDIAALAEMDEKIIVFKSNGIFAEAGDGVNDDGNGSTLSFPQTVPSDVGCSVLKSTITTPRGVMFKSANGIYMIDRKLNVVYMGAEVEAYNSQVISGVSLVPGKSQIRFLCSSGLTLVFDYIFNQWSTFTNHTGVSSSTWNNSYVYSTGSAIFQESTSSYADNGAAYALLAQTSWLALASIQGFQRVKRLIVLGDFVNGNSASHNLSIAAAYDFSTTFQAAVTYAFGAVSGSGIFQYRERLPIQKCDSISLLIQETTTGSSAEYIDLTNISFEAGVKKGVNKLGGTKSVG